jgi:hypothetical protein
MKGLLIRVDFKGCAIIGRTCDPELDGFGDVEELWKHWDGPPYVSASALFHCLWFLITTWITTFTTFTTHHPLTTLMTLGNNENFSPWDSRHLGITVAPPDLFAGPAFRRSAHIEASVKRIGWSDRWILRQAECQNGRVFQWIMWYQLISIDIYIYINWYHRYSKKYPKDITDITNIRHWGVGNLKPQDPNSSMAATRASFWNTPGMVWVRRFQIWACHIAGFACCVHTAVLGLNPAMRERTFSIELFVDLC